MSIALALITQIVLAESSFALKIDRTPTSLTALGAGTSRTYTFTLDEPIICADVAVTCAVTLSFSNSSPGTATLNTSSITWASSEWSQIRSITLTVDSDLVYTDSSSVVLSATAVSNAEYYSGFAVSFNQPISLPLSPTEIAAADRAAAEEDARIRQIEVDNYRKILFAKLIKGERPTLLDYNNAAFNQIVARTIESVTTELLALDVVKRVDVQVINQVADRAAYLDAFFNPLFRPTLESYVRHGFTGVTERTLKVVNEKVLAISENKRSQRELIQDIANQEGFIDRVANPSTRAMVTASILISKGLLPSDTVYKYSVVQGLTNYAEGSLNSMAKIEAAIKAEIEKAGARKAKTEAIKAKIAARRK